MARWLASLILILALSSSQAHAWITTRVGEGGATVYAESSLDSAQIGHLDPGTLVNTTNASVDGFFFCTPEAGKGNPGWVQIVDLVPKSGPGTPGTANGQKASSSKKKSERPSAPEEPPASNVFIGGFMGAGIYTANTAFTGGLVSDYRLNAHWALGFYGSYSALPVNPVNANLPNANTLGGANFLIAAPEANYYFSRNLNGFHVGARLGLGFVSTDTVVNGATTTQTATGIALGGQAGYDWLALDSFTVGGEFNLFHLSTGGSPTVVNFLVVAKIWL